jgi:DNA-binding transcriptional MerR regulator
MGSNIAQIKEELKNNEKNNQKLIAENTKNVNILTKEKEHLQKLLDELKTSNIQAGNMNSSELLLLKKVYFVFVINLYMYVHTPKYMYIHINVYVYEN